MVAQRDDAQYPMSSLCEEWLRKIDAGKKRKREDFGQYAEEASKFYDGAHNWMWEREYATSSTVGFLDKEGGSDLPGFRMTVNKVFEAVALFGPALMHKYPSVTVTPSIPPDIPPEILGIDVQNPYHVQMYQQAIMAQQQRNMSTAVNARLAEHYLNWLQVETDKKSHARRAITEAIVKGLGILWCELYSPRGGSIRYPRSTFVSCDDIIKDPDAEVAEGVTWIARHCIHPVNRVAQKYGLDESRLRGHLQSISSQSTKMGRRDAKTNKDPTSSQTYDLVDYWEVYSKNGFGHRLKALKSIESYRSRYEALEAYGDFCYIAVAKDIPYPLNLPPERMAEPLETQLELAGWPIPFWTDEGCSNGWPMTELHFYEKMNCVWPLSLIKPAIGEIRFINWCMSFLADKVAAASKTYIGVVKAAGEDIQQQIKTGKGPYTIVEISDLLGKSVHDLVSFLDAPAFSIDIWKMVSETMTIIDRRTGLTELVYGLSSTQMRSATEAGVKNEYVSIRPDDMAERTEDFYSGTVLKEFEAAVWALSPEDVVGVLGSLGAQVFSTVVQTQDFDSVVRDYRYRIAAGSARKPNKQMKLQQLNDFGRVAVPAMQMFAQSGVVGPWNAFCQDVAESMDLDGQRYLLPEPPPQEEQGPTPEQQEMQMKTLEFQQDMAQGQAKEEREEESHEQDMEIREEELAMQKKESDAKISASKAAAKAKARAPKPVKRSP